MKKITFSDGMTNITANENPEVNVLDWQEEWPGEGKDGNATFPEHNAYGSVAVEVDGQWITVGVCVGVPEWKIGTATAAGSTRGLITAWFESSSDWDDVAPEDIDAVHDALVDEAPRLWAEAQAERPAPEKSGVRDWETVETYCVVDAADDLVAYEVEVQVGAAVVGGREAWFLRTIDDADGDDCLDDEAYDSFAAAREAGDNYARENDETDGLAPDEYARATLLERAGQPDDDGDWCVFWWSASQDEEHVVARYASREEAEAAATLAQDNLASQHPGGRLLCGYEVRALVEGEWVTVDAQ